MERCLRLFRLRTGSAGLLEDKNGCRMVSDVRCAVCDSRVVVCGEFERIDKCC